MTHYAYRVCVAAASSACYAMWMASGVLPRRGYVGLTLGSAPARGGGLLVRAVAPASSAEHAGVRPGDLLTHLDRNPAVDLVEVRTLLRGLRPSDPLLLEVVRNGETVSLTTTVAAFPVERYEVARTELGQVDAGSHWLRAISVVPDAGGPHPVVYFLPGAHWTSEEYPLSPEHPVPALLSALASAGFASVRVERSGLGDSQGPSCTRVGFTDELEGFRAGLRFITEQSWADRTRVFVFAHSLGAMIAPLLAQSGCLAGVACYAASAIPISEALVGAIVRYAELTRTTEPSLADHVPLIAELIRLVVCGARTPEEVFAERPDLAKIAPSHFSGDQAYHRIARFYHELEGVDLESAWKALHVPALFLHGSRDWISTAEDSHRLARLVGPSARAETLPGVDHQMSDSPEGAPPRLAPSLAGALVDWFVGNARAVNVHGS